MASVSASGSRCPSSRCIEHRRESFSPIFSRGKPLPEASSEPSSKPRAVSSKGVQCRSTTQRTSKLYRSSRSYVFSSFESRSFVVAVPRVKRILGAVTASDNLDGANEAEISQILTAFYRLNDSNRDRCPERTLGEYLSKSRRESGRNPVRGVSLLVEGSNTGETRSFRK